MGKIVLAVGLGLVVGTAGVWGSARWQWQQFQRRIPPQEEFKVVVYPQPGQKLSAAPNEVKITFPAAVDKFEIEIRRDWNVVLSGDLLPKISADRIMVSQPFPATSAGIGTFVVTYKGCPAAITSACFGGQFDFTVEGE